MNSTQNCSSNPNTKRKNKKRKNRNQRYKNTKFQNGYDNSQINEAKQNGDSVKLTNPLPSSPRPTDFNNFTLENKRCSGSEYEEFHTPNYEYPEILKNEINVERNNSTDDEWDEIARFSKSNLEGIPEQDHFHNHRTHIIDEENFQNLSFTSYKSKSGKNKKIKKPNGQNNVQSKEVCTNINIVNVNQVSNVQLIVKEKLEEPVGLVNGHVTVDEDVLIGDDLDCKTPISESIQPAYIENDDHKQNESEENEPSICTVIEVNSHVIENNLDFFVDSMNSFDDERRFSLVCDYPSVSSNNNKISEKDSEEQDQESQSQTIYFETNTILTDDKQDNEDFPNEESIDCLKKDKSFISNDYYFDEKIQEMEEYMFDHPKSQFAEQFNVFFNKDMENNSTIDTNKTDFILSTEEESENIHCTDENLEAEVLKVIEFKSEIFLKPTIKKSMTLGSRDHPSSDRQSATTITNVTSISDENINLNYDSDCKPSKSSKKRNKFVKTVLNKLRKKKVNTKIEKTEDIKSSTEDRLVENNEYFDDASIDCNSHAKGFEIDSNKALKSYDESINNYGDPKHNDDHNDCENNFSDDEENKLENVEGLSKPNIKKMENEFQNDKLSIKIKELDQSSTEKESPSSRSMNFDKQEKVKKKKIFTLFSKKSNNNKNNNNSKNVSKPKDDPKVNDIPKSTDMCDEKVDISTGYRLTQALNDQDILKIETNLPESLLNDQEMSPSPGEPLKSDMETLDQSFKFLNNFESSPVKETRTTGTDKSSDHEKCSENNNDIDFYLCANIENNTTSEEIPKKKRKSKNKNDERLIPKNEDITNDNLKTKVPKDKQKKRFWTLFGKGKKKQDTGKERRKSWTYENPDDEDEMTKEKVLENEQPKKEDQHFSDFNDVYNSLNPKIITKNETVVCKNKNDFPRKEIEEDLTNKDIVYINDDHLFPDSLTPSKITHLEPGEPYSFAFIDDPVIVEQDKCTMFNGENKKVLIFSESCAPFASSETLFTSEDSDQIEMCEKSKSPIRTLKRPLSSLLGLLSRYR